MRRLYDNAVGTPDIGTLDLKALRSCACLCLRNFRLILRFPDFCVFMQGCGVFLLQNKEKCYIITFGIFAIFL